ncbi:hypothetical protein CSOJ01_03114 [Colletotrichum sojae]|uniref:Uncharacterized protein n=1 Tax=Colletotrichum sojae TaxID=2175907 RepID=A0A8H6JNI1_9PEZI|nr:hypothetical protein CSOJ01_03114 [Colletotrichum sojae]
MTKKQQGSDWCVRKGQASCEFNTSRSRAQGSSVLREAQEEDGVWNDNAGGVTVALLHSEEMGDERQRHAALFIKQSPDDGRNLRAQSQVLPSGKSGMQLTFSGPPAWSSTSGARAPVVRVRIRDGNGTLIFGEFFVSRLFASRKFQLRIRWTAQAHSLFGAREVNDQPTVTLGRRCVLRVVI